MDAEVEMDQTAETVIVRLRVQLQGAVQGVGMRPFLFGLAKRYRLVGWVRNSGVGVVCEVQGHQLHVRQFAARLEQDKPRSARIDFKECEWLSPRPSSDFADFTILPSQACGQVRVTVPPDEALCEECYEELMDRSNRRYRYPFISCTQCGPRWSIAAGVIFDRESTAMRQFQMCRTCRSEYANPLDRRFHHQANACDDCGPQWSLLDAGGNLLANSTEVLSSVVAALRAGDIVAVKGVGGYQLMVDAQNPRAIERLRTRKNRPRKPFAIMVKNIEMAQELCQISPLERRILTSRAAPITLLTMKSGWDGHIAAGVSMGSPLLGVMLPASPLHLLLIDAFAASAAEAVVVTSGNISGEPLSISDAEALTRLANIADLFLVHDREITRPLDDSVVQVVCNQSMVLRRSRGYVPCSFSINFLSINKNCPPVLCKGSALKNTVGLLRRDEIILGPYIGDLDTVAAMDEHQRQCTELSCFFDPELCVTDAHADHFEVGLPLDIRMAPPIQHHHAHVAAVIAEHQLSGSILGVAWDGFGMGLDGCAWGGEFLAIRPRNDKSDAQRLGHFSQFLLVGNDQAARETVRSALGAIYTACQRDIERVLYLFSKAQFQVPHLPSLVQVMQSPRYCTPTSSVGRLFDAVAFLLGLADENQFEGEAAMAVQYAAQSAKRLPSSDNLVAMKIVKNSELYCIDWGDTLLELLEQRLAGCSVNELALLFHRALVGAAEQLVLRLSEESGIDTVVMSGGCFQNRLLSELLVASLQQHGLQVFWPQAIPPNDGGIAAGQALIMAKRMLG